MNRFEAIECVYRCCEDRKKNSPPRYLGDSEVYGKNLEGGSGGERVTAARVGIVGAARA
jgi:hypothetical protein